VKGYQAGISKFEQAGAKVLLISTDNLPTLKHWAGELGVSYPLLSDFAERKVAKAYGVLIAGRGMANRVTFVIGKNGKIEHIDNGKDAVDPTGALNACSRLKH